MCISVYLASVQPLKDESLFRRAWEAASPERREKTDRFRKEGDKRLSFGAELLLRKALRDHGRGAQRIVYAYGEGKKPYLPGAEGFFFNLSHAGEYVLCAVSDEDIGCDIEETARDGMAIARRFFSREEFEMIEAQPSRKEQDEQFLRYWTLKESYVKCSGRGLKMPLEDFTVRPGTDGDACVIQDGAVSPCYLKELVLPGEVSAAGYHAAVCRKGGKCEVKIETVDLEKELSY